MTTVATCSHCTATALYVGNGQDSDLYCSQHRGLAREGSTLVSPARFGLPDARRPVVSAGTWAKVQSAYDDLDAAAEAYDANPGDDTSKVWEDARDALNQAVRDHKARQVTRPPVSAPVTASEGATTYDDQHWSYEPGDPDVGIFGGQWSHESCPAEYEQGVNEDSTRAGAADPTGHALFRYELTCLDCEAQTSFLNPEFVGEDQ